MTMPARSATAAATAASSGATASSGPRADALAMLGKLVDIYKGRA